MYGKIRNFIYENQVCTAKSSRSTPQFTQRTASRGELVSGENSQNVNKSRGRADHF
jgi:hypothetical protein